MTTPVIMYGIWVKGQGWLRGAGGDVVAFEVKAVAESTADRLGSEARVEYIDNALRDIEQYLLSVERIQEENRPINKIRRWMSDYSKAIQERTPRT